MATAAAVMACATSTPSCGVFMRPCSCACMGSTSPMVMTALRSSFRGLAVAGSLQSNSSAKASSTGLAAQRTAAPIVAASGYKLKTHKAAAKRFRVTGSGKIVRRQAGKAHLLRKKSTSRKNRLTGTVCSLGLGLPACCEIDLSN